ncbi:MAG TPA: hypothetical protein VND64_18500 [Pirellulales bacterium]|nr:hypothetical protein [Pirellulales bacterium]
MDFDKVFSNPTEILAAIEFGAREALLQHKRAGNPIAVWRDGQVVWIPPEEIEVDEPPTSASSASGHSRKD